MAGRSAGPMARHGKANCPASSKRKGRTLSEAAEKLHVAPSTLSRSLKKLEDAFGVPLFIHEKKNRILLNDNGLFAAAQAENVLASAESMIRQVRFRDRSMRQISVGSVSPGIAIDMVNLLARVHPEAAVSTEVQVDNELLLGLHKQTYHLVILDFAPEGNELLCQKCGRVHICACLPPGHRCAGRTKITAAELDGETFLTSTYAPKQFLKICQDMMPGSRFIPIDGDNIRSVAGSSSMPGLSSDVALRIAGPWKERVIVPIADPEAHLDYYCVCLAAYSDKFRPLFRELRSKYGD